MNTLVVLMDGPDVVDWGWAKEGWDVRMEYPFGKERPITGWEIWQVAEEDRGPVEEALRQQRHAQMGSRG